MDQIRILLADDHPLVSEGTRRILEQNPRLTIVGDADNGEDALELAKSLQPDVAILDIRMPKLNGIEVVKNIKDYSPDTKTLILTAYDDDDYILALMEAGATGYLLKTCRPEELIDAVERVHLGNTVLDPAIMAKVTHLWANYRDKPANQLTTREHEILELAAEGLRNKTIAEQLNISIRTVEGHFNNIFAKLQVNSRVEAILFAVSQNMVKLNAKREDMR
ncbi:MAG: response regulator transcription factor [Dehalococcoidales bacterium]